MASSLSDRSYSAIQAVWSALREDEWKSFCYDSDAAVFHKLVKPSRLMTIEQIHHENFISIQKASRISRASDITPTPAQTTEIAVKE